MEKIDIKIYFYENFRHITGKDSEILNCALKTKLEDFLKINLLEKYGDSFKKIILDEKNNIRHMLLILVNGNIVKNLSEYILSNNDEITLLLPVAGG